MAATSTSAATKSRKLNGNATLGGAHAAFSFSLGEDESKHSAKRVLAASVAEALTIGLGIAATVVVGDLLLAALTVSVGTFIAIALCIAFWLLAFTATFMAGGVVRNAVMSGVIESWYHHAKNTVVQYRNAFAG